MTPKMAYYSALAESAARDITSSRDQWTAFLTTSARLYKYPYSDQLMIFAQRPDATACAEYDLWNDKMRRYIKRGSKGIALVDNSGERPRLRYVFDVSDTGTRRDSRPVELWQMQEEHEPAIMEALSAAFDVSGERVGLDDLIYSAARKLAGEYWEDHSRQIFDIVADSYLEGYDEFNIGAAFRNAAATSIAYSVFSRSTVDADSYFEPENFLDIFDFNTQAASNVLGTAVTEMSGQIFREIERTIRNYERNRQAERSQNYDGTDLQTERRFSDSRNPAGDARGETSGQVRQDEESIPAGEQFAPVQSSDTDRETVPSPVGDSGHRNDESRTADGSADAAESGTGQEDTTDGMGTAHEHAESTGRGNSDRRTDYSVTHTDSFGQLSFLFPSEAEQIAKLDNTETIAESTQPSAFVISEDEVDRALRGGSGFSGGKMRIYALYQLQGDPKERAKFLKDEYGMGGHSYTFADGSHGFVDYNAKGLYIRSYEHDREKRLTWAEVDKALDQLIQKGEYLNGAEFSRYQQMEEDYGAALPMPTPAHVFPPANKIEQIENEEETAHLPDIGEVQGESEPEDGDFHEEDMLSSDSPANADEEFRVGDTVELDGKTFVIENVGMFDVQLRDPASVFPIFRAESKEHLRELLHNEVIEHGAEQEQDIPVDTAVEDAAIASTIAAQNFRITDTHLGEGGPKQKFRANMDAIHMLQTLEAEKRNATPEEQEILSKYVGWGGLADAFDENKSSWSAEYQELKNALSPEEYAAARASTLNAHYTSPTVIHAIYDAVEQMGFTKGNILEPAMGVGNFFGMMPESMEGSRLYGVELDSVTGRIAQKLYPNAEITVAGFETTDRRDFYDLAVGNVPFGNYKVSDKPYDKLGFSIHNYFFAKTLDQVRPGGVVAFVTSRYTAVGGERRTVQLIDVTVTSDGYEFGYEKLERWIAMCQRCGVKYFEISHLFSQWGAVATPKIVGMVDGKEEKIFGWQTKATGEEYSAFMRQFLVSFTEKLKSMGIEKQCYFHISDEPSLEQKESYRAAKEMVSEYLKDFHMIDALSDFNFYKEGIVDEPICATNHIEPFLKERPEKLWAYYCIGQYLDVSNRFIVQPGYRTRILGVQLYKYDIDGFLHWGYNFYNSQYSLYPINPYQCTDAGEAFASGDPFVVYPGKDGKPEESMRLMYMNEAMQDLMVMKYLEQLTDKSTVMNCIEWDGMEELTFSKYPRNLTYLQHVKEKVYKEIKRNI